MSTIGFFERDVTDAEFAQVNAGFDEHTIEHGNPIEIQERYSVVIMDGETFVGSASGGDGKTDVCVFRPESGTWYQMKSAQGFGAVQFGANGDKPAPNAFVP